MFSKPSKLPSWDTKLDMKLPRLKKQKWIGYEIGLKLWHVLKMFNKFSVSLVINNHSFRGSRTSLNPLPITKKGVLFNWTNECWDALEKLIAKVTEDPVLTIPDLDRQFELETDASNFALGTVLFQKDDRGKWYAIGYASKTLNAAEQNYDIWDKEFLSLIFGLTKWHHHLMCTKEPVLTFVDHANLAYYRHPQKINQ